MKKMGIAFLAGAFVLVSVASGYAGPNVGGRNYNIQSREISQNRIDARNHMYALTGTPRDVSNWKWRTAKRTWRNYKGPTAPMMKRIPAS